MATTVKFDERCRFALGERPPDQCLLIRENIRAMIDLLGTTGGLPAGATRIATALVPRHIWEEKNWKIVYRRVESETLGSIRVTVTIEYVKLKT